MKALAPTALALPTSMKLRFHLPATAAVAGLLALFVMSCGSAAQPASAPARTAAPQIAAATSQPEALSTAPLPVATVAPVATEAPATAAPTEVPAVQTPAPSVAPATPAPTAAAAIPAPTAAPTAEPKTGPVAVSLTDIAIKLDQSWTSAGSVTFSIKNVGSVVHQLVVLKTDIPQNQIPVSTTSPGTVTQPGFVGTTALINPGGSATLTLALTSGNYVLLCNQPAHYLIGMHIGFKVN